MGVDTSSGGGTGPLSQFRPENWPPCQAVLGFGLLGRGGEAWPWAWAQARWLPLALGDLQEKGQLGADGSMCSIPCPSLGVLGTSRHAALMPRLCGRQCLTGSPSQRARRDGAVRRDGEGGAGGRERRQWREGAPACCLALGVPLVCEDEMWVRQEGSGTAGSAGHCCDNQVHGQGLILSRRLQSSRGRELTRQSGVAPAVYLSWAAPGMAHSGLKIKQTRIRTDREELL